MEVTDTSDVNPPWLFFMFRLPAQRASQRVKVWRKLQRYGALAWNNSAYILPHTPSNLEKFQWLTREVRKHRGDASILKVTQIEGTTHKQVTALFNVARVKDYKRLVRDARFALRSASSRSAAQLRRVFARLNQRLTEIASIDVFGCTKRKEAEASLKELEARTQGGGPTDGPRREAIRGYQGCTWMTRPRPGVDRVASAWLIKNFIDRRARFTFSSDPHARDGAIRFDMFEGEFTHVGDDCTFETLLKRFRPRDRRLRRIAQIVHDADLDDHKFGRTEGKAIDEILIGWAKMGWSDAEILKRGFDLYDALYMTLQS